MIPSLDKDYRTNFLFILVAWITMLLEKKKKADRKKNLVQIPHPLMYSLYIQGLLYLCRDKNTQVLQQDVVLQVVFVQA